MTFSPDKSFKKRPLALLMAGVLGSLSLSVYAQDTNNNTEEDEQDTDLGKIVVTGSRIARTDIEGPQPVTVLTAADIEKQGFTTAFEALQSLTQFNGSIQDDQFSGGFTQGASTLDLRALGPGRTLILLNGRRATDYPLPFNGQSNVVNLANIPSVMIERIEVLSAGASAIYGSDAVAGVVNIIMKKDVDGLTISARYGDTSEGGGQSKRIQISGGWNPGNFHITYGFEYFDRDPIYAFQRDYQDSFADDPTLSGLPRIQDPDNGYTNSRTFLILDPFDGNGDGFTYIDPGAEACDPLSHLVRGSTEYSFRSGGRGFYCGTPESVSSFSIRNGRENYSLFSNFTYDFGNGHEAFGHLIYTDSETRFDTGARFWQHDLSGPLGGGLLINTQETDAFGVGGAIEVWQRIFSHEEAGGFGAKDDVYDETLADYSVGIRGPLGDNWDYEFSYSHSEYDLTRERLLISVSKADQFFLGDPVGSFDFAAFGFPPGTVVNQYAADRSRVYQPLTPAEYRSISTIDRTFADSQNDQINLVVTSPNLFEMPAGPVGFAAILESASQDYDINLDPQLLSGEIFGFTGTGGGGERDRYALGVEFNVPIFSTLTASVAGRLDKYDDITRVDDAFTYNFGLEWRPTRNFLVRGSAASSFRAPDMHYVFAEASGFFSTATDRYKCLRDEGDVVGDLNGNKILDAGENWNFTSCTFDGVQIEGVRRGNPGLEEEEGKSFNVGFVWEIMKGMSLSVDYYDIELDNVVNDLNVSLLLRDEAECLFGVTSGGMPVDINSQECQDTLGRITRTPFVPGEANEFISEALDVITTGPINQAFLRVSGVDTNFRYTLPTDNYGTFSLDTSWNVVVESEFQQFEGDQIFNLRSNRTVEDFRSRFRGSLTWDIGNWSSTLFALRTGSIPRWDETDRCCSHVTYNWSLQYSFNDNSRLSLFVQNLRNSRPPFDPSRNNYPYYSQFVFDPYGREIFVQYDHTFGK